MLRKYIRAYLREAPIRDLERVGKWQGTGSFRSQDQKLLTNPKAIEKIRQQWSKTPYTFDVYLLNIPELNKYPFKEYGELVAGSEVDVAVKDGLGHEVPRKEDVITILYNGNYGQNKVPMTGWVMAHRVGHVVSRRNNMGGKIEAWNAYTKEVNYMLREILQVFHGAKDLLTKTWDWEKTASNEKKLKYIAQQLGTFKSAREGNLTNFYEFYHELLAQWLITGSITFNPLPRSLVVNKRNWGHEDRTYTQDTDWLDEINEMLPSYASHIERKLEQMFDGLVGKTFLM
jgi:hypothetical protein